MMKEMLRSANSGETPIVIRTGSASMMVSLIQKWYSRMPEHVDHLPDGVDRCKHCSIDAASQDWITGRLGQKPL
jgi:hypothetical protein